MSTPPAIGGDEGDSEDWLITYADAITLLMAFFVMMFSISEVSDEKYEEVAGGILSEIIGKDAAIAQPFKTILQSQMQNREEGEGKMEAEATRRGMTFNFDSKDIFKSGSAELLAAAVPKLDRVSQMITLLGISELFGRRRGPHRRRALVGKRPLPDQLGTVGRARHQCG